MLWKPAALRTARNALTSAWVCPCLAWAAADGRSEVEVLDAAGLSDRLVAAVAERDLVPAPDGI